VNLRRLILNPISALQALDADETVTLLKVSHPLPVWGAVAYALCDVAGICFNGLAGE
jgi:DNA polymerase V